MRRRSFLTLLGTTGAAALAGCTATSTSHRPSTSPSGTPQPATLTPSSGPPVTSTPRTTRTTMRTATSLQQLGSQLDGEIVVRGQQGYGHARRAYDPAFDGLRPAAVVRCSTADDVARTVEYAARSRTKIAARSGGHSYAGYSTPNHGIVVDLSPMSRVEVTGSTARVGAGARLIDVYTALARAGRALPAGSCPTVGIGGHAQGGGVGVLTRSYGLTCDRIVGADVVTADGVLHHVSAGSDPDLFWALRGGGGGNLGIVTSFTFSTEPAPPLVKFGLQFSDGSATDVLDAWQQVSPDAPDELNINLSITASDDPSAFVYGTYLGSESAANQQLRAFVQRTGAQPTYRQVATMSVEAAMYSYAQCTGKTLAQSGPDWTGHGSGTIPRSTFVGTSRILRAAVDPDAFVNAVRGSNIAVLVDPLSGAAGRVSPDATAFAHRGALASVQLYQTGSDPSAIDTVRTSLGRLLGPYGYVNYIDATMPDWGRAYYAGNLPRLQTVARRYDPDRVFRFAQNVQLA